MNRKEISLPPYDLPLVERRYRKALEEFGKKILVLDDDPTGVQTVHGVYVYTDWSKDSIRQGLAEENRIFFILTNSRAFSSEETKQVHREIAENILALTDDFVLVSRGDSTLRGHYPLETETLRETIESQAGYPFDGEIIIPFFPEGGRLTVHNTHYVASGDVMTPAGETEFARDKTFGYKSSHLGQWVEEKTQGKFKEKNVVYISLDQLRSLDYQGITQKLTEVKDFNKVVVNAVEYPDVKVFVTALLDALKQGKHFLFRSAAAFTKILGGVSDKPVLEKDELVDPANPNGGLVIIGSHVQKTTAQFEKLREKPDVAFLEFNQHLVVDDAAMMNERDRVVREAGELMAQGKTVAVYTRRDRFDANTGNKEDELRYATKISSALTSVVSKLSIKPRFIVAKGGITSSDVGTVGLGVKKALVMGQILQGVPVWLTGEESKFPHMPYVIFPGNVGDENGLLSVVEKLGG